MKTLQEKYNAVLEGNFPKSQFVRDAKMEVPRFISPYNGFEDTVQILKNKGMLVEAKAETPEYDKPAPGYSLEALERGVDYELEKAGVDTATETATEGQYENAKKKAEKNLEKDPNFYLHLLSGDSKKVDKHDREVEVDQKKLFKGTVDPKGGKAEGNTDTYNAMKKATLREAAMAKGYTKDQVEAAIKRLQEKKGKLNERTDIVPTAELKASDAFRDAGIDMNEPVLVLTQDGGHGPQETKGTVSAQEALKMFQRLRADGIKSGREDHYEFDNEIDFHAEGYEYKLAYFEEESTTTALMQKATVEENKATKDHDGDGEVESKEDEYKGVKDKAIKKAMGKKANVNEAVKNIITKILEEEVINEAATNELARIADEYGSFEGLKPAVIALENIVTEIEAFYDKTRAKIQKIYDDLGEVRNDEGLKVGAFIAPSIENAFVKDLKHITKQQFHGGLDMPKVKRISQADVDRGYVQQEAPKETIFTPVNEKK